MVCKGDCFSLLTIIYNYSSIVASHTHSAFELFFNFLVRNIFPTMAPWADSPFPLIPTSKTTKPNAHPDAIWIADQMANVHSCFIRALNAMYQQAPYIERQEDIRDFCQYGVFWGEVVQYVGLFYDFEGIVPRCFSSFFSPLSSLFSFSYGYSFFLLLCSSLFFPADRKP